VCWHIFVRLLQRTLVSLHTTSSQHWLSLIREWVGGWGRREPDSNLDLGNGKNHKEHKYKDKNVVYIGTNIDREAEKESVGSVLAQITTNRGVLTASTHNCQPTMPLLLHVVTTNHNQQNSRCVSTNHK